MSGTRLAVLIGAIPVVVALISLGLQVAFGEETEWFAVDGTVFDEAGDLVATMAGTMDPAGVVLLLALGIAMGFGFAIILRGARDL